MRRFFLVASLAMVVAIGAFVAAQTVSGTWDVEIMIDPLAGTIAEFLDFHTTGMVSYEVGGWAFTAVTELDDTGWIDQTFSVGGLLGAFSIGMDLDLDPAGAFETWEVTVGTTFGGVIFDFDFTLADLDTTLVVGAATSTTSFEVDVTTTFGGDDNDICDFNWAGVEIAIGFPFCCAEISATIAFDCDGFDYVLFGVDDVGFSALPWLTLDADLTYRLQTKELVVSPDFDFDTGLCFDVYISVDEQTGSEIIQIGDIHIGGLKLVCEFDSVTFTGISFWGSTGKPGELGSYWEMYKIESNDETCCGPISFEAEIFFDESSNNLMDVSLFEFELEVELGDPLTFALGAAFDIDAATTEFIFDFLIEF